MDEKSTKTVRARASRLVMIFDNRFYFSQVEALSERNNNLRMQLGVFRLVVNDNVRVQLGLIVFARFPQARNVYRYRQISQLLRSTPSAIVRILRRLMKLGADCHYAFLPQRGA